MLLLLFVAAGTLVVASLAYHQLEAYTEENSRVRIDRAARAASAIMQLSLGDQIVIDSRGGLPTELRLLSANRPDQIAKDSEFDKVVNQIGTTNQGAANLFVWNDATSAFDRFATTFRKPDGTMPPPMSIGAGHPAYDNLVHGKFFKGNVPVMGRLRLAYLMPILSQTNEIAGILAVDVGFADDFFRARDELRTSLLWSTAAILLMVAAIGAHLVRRNLRPVADLSRFAHKLAEGDSDQPLPFAERTDEVGQLARGLGRVVDLQNRLETLAYTDTVTQLGNRPSFLADLEKAVSNSFECDDRSAALLMLDLDHFKEVNDAHGHRAGDAVLHEIGRRILAQIPPRATASRIGGDEFAVVTAAMDREEVKALCVRVLDSVAQPISIPEGQVHTQASIGIALIPEHAKTSADAYLHGDLALRKAKSEGRNLAVMFTEDLLDTARETMELASMLRDAVQNGELALHFQPQALLDPLRVVGFEALARWEHPARGFIPPSEFIPVAETNGLIVELGNWVLNEACRTGQQWLDLGLEFSRISVNVSPVQLWQSDFVDTVLSALDSSGFPPERLCLEITESFFADDRKGRAIAKLGALRAAGVLISLDDFGSGYSSLSYLNRMPLDELKIDRSFVSGVDKDPRMQQVLGGIVALGKGLGLSIVAEGAETLQEVESLKALGCNCIQGFFFSRPVAANLVPLAISRIQGLTTDRSSSAAAEVSRARPSGTQCGRSA